MGGTVQGGKMASEKNKQRYGEDFYKRIGAMGGRNGNTGGFYGNSELASRAGKIGGAISKRTKSS